MGLFDKEYKVDDNPGFRVSESIKVMNDEAASKARDKRTKSKPNYTVPAHVTARVMEYLRENKVFVGTGVDFGREFDPDRPQYWASNLSKLALTGKIKREGTLDDAIWSLTDQSAVQKNSTKVNKGSSDILKAGQEFICIESDKITITKNNKVVVINL